MANDPYAGLIKPVTPPEDTDPYAGILRELTPVTAQVPRRTLLETGVEGVQNIPESGLQFGRGIYEAITNPLETLGGALDVGAGALYLGAKEVLPKEVMDFIASMDNPEAVDRAVKAAKQFGGMMAYRYGSVDKIKNTLATDPVGFAADMSTLFSGGATAAGRLGLIGRELQLAQRAKAIGGLRSAAEQSRLARNFARNAETVSAGLNRAADWTNPVNALRPLGRGVTNVVQKAPLKIANFMSPKSAMYMDIAEGRGNELVQQLRASDEIVPGSTPTAAQQASPLGLTQFSAVGEAAAKIDPSTYYALGNMQDAARLRALEGIGGTPDNLSALREGRELTAEQKYGAVRDNVVTTDDALRALLKRPSMDVAFKRARELADEKGIPFQMGPDILPGSMAGMATPGRPAQYTVQSLHVLKMAMDDLVRNPERFGIGATEAGAIRQTQKSLVNWIEDKAPGYKTARETFARQSRRINQAEVGQFLQDKLTSALTQEAPLRAATFATAVREAPTTIKRATTGASRYEKLTDLLDPHQAKVVEDIKRDLAREQITKTQAREGGNAAPRVAQLASQTGDMPTLLNRVATVANAIYNRLQGKIDRKLAMQIAYEMAVPERAAAALEQAMVREAFARLAGQGGGAATRAMGNVLTSTPAKVAGQFQNVMAQGENRNALAQAQFPKFNEEGAPLTGVSYATDENGFEYAYPVYGVPPRR